MINCSILEICIFPSEFLKILAFCLIFHFKFVLLTFTFYESVFLFIRRFLSNAKPTPEHLEIYPVWIYNKYFAYLHNKRYTFAWILFWVFLCVCYAGFQRDSCTLIYNFCLIYNTLTLVYNFWMCAHTDSEFMYSEFMNSMTWSTWEKFWQFIFFEFFFSMFNAALWLSWFLVLL